MKRLIMTLILKRLIMTLMLTVLSFAKAHSAVPTSQCPALFQSAQPSFLHPEKARDLELQLSLAVRNLLTQDGIMLLYGEIPTGPMSEVFNFKPGTRAYAKSVVAGMTAAQKAKIVDYLYAAHINHYFLSGSKLSEPTWEFNQEVVHGPWLTRLVMGKQKTNILTDIFAAREEANLRKFVEDNIDSFIVNGISMKTVKFSLLAQRALSVCAGAACSYLLEADPTLAFSILAAIPARELLRKDRPFVFGFKSEIK